MYERSRHIYRAVAAKSPGRVNDIRTSSSSPFYPMVPGQDFAEAFKNSITDMPRDFKLNQPTQGA